MTAPRTVRLVKVMSLGDLTRRTVGNDDVWVAAGRPWVARGGIVLVMSPKVRAVMVALLACPQRAWSGRELVEVLYGEDKDGGPENAENALSKYIYNVRSLALAAGIVIEQHAGHYAARLK